MTRPPCEPCGWPPSRRWAADRSLGIVDDMSGPFALAYRHRLGRRLDAGALAELVVAGRLSAERAQAELAAAIQG